VLDNARPIHSHNVNNSVRLPPGGIWKIFSIVHPPVAIRKRSVNESVLDSWPEGNEEIECSLATLSSKRIVLDVSCPNVASKSGLWIALYI
jgi:hypothetical protein